MFVCTLSVFFSSKCSFFHNSNAFGSCIIHILYTGCAKIKKNNSGAKRLKQSFRSVYRHEVDTRLSHKPWTQEISKVTDWPRRRAVAEFRLCVGHDCLGAHLHRIGIRPDPYSTLCSLHEPTDRNHLGQCTALTDKTECERYWEDRTINDGKLTLLFYYYYFFL